MARVSISRVGYQAKLLEMSFLDNLENNLKALESQDQGGIDEAARRDAERRQARAAAPWAERLKNGPWTQALMQQATRAGHQRRTKVHFAWIGTTLRLEARGLRLELRPSAKGVDAVFLKGAEEAKRAPVDLDGDPAKLVYEWMLAIDIQKKMDEEEAARALEEHAADE